LISKRADHGVWDIVRSTGAMFAQYILKYNGCWGRAAGPKDVAETIGLLPT
jgi:hypothetical protein